MKNSTLTLLIGAVVVAVNALEKNMHVLDSVTDFNSGDEEANNRLISKHKAVVSRLDSLVCNMRAAELSGENSVFLNPMELHSVNRAALDQIAELDKSMAYFCQMGESEMVVRS